MMGPAGGGFWDPRPYAMIYGELIRQATLMAFVDNFRWVGLICLACVPSVFLFHKVKAQEKESLPVH